MRSVSSRSLLLILAGIVFAGGATLPAQFQVKPVAELPSEVALRLMLRKLNSIGTFMETTAHPDDEDNPLLAMLGHGEGMRTALVTATRGDGGQNEIGPEIFQALGVLRTEELAAAHRFDGAEQYFTRAVDFGYSFSVEESLEKWGHDEILGDYVRHIRTIRPDVIAGFVCGGEGGGQHHQASARLTAEAFRAAADPSKFPEQIQEGLRPWQARRVFCTDASGFGPPSQRKPATPDLITVSVSGFDPLLGRSYAEIGTEARSMHKCQGMSQLLLLPGQTGFGTGGRTYRQQDTVLGEKGIAPPSLFDGIDTTLAGLAAFAGPRPPAQLTAGIKEIAGAVRAATQLVATDGQFAAARPLAMGLNAVRTLRAKLAGIGLNASAQYEIDFRLEQKERQFEQALVLSQGMRLEALADDGVVVAGQPVTLSLIAANNGRDAITLDRVSIAGLEGTPAACSKAIAGRAHVSCTSNVKVPAAAPLTTAAYWKPRADASRYDFDPDVPFGVPFRPSPFRVTFELTIAGARVSAEQVIEHRYGDLFGGEKRMEVTVVPSFSVRTTPEIAVIPASGVPNASQSRREIKVTVTNHGKEGRAGTVSIVPPAGWQVLPASTPVKFTREDEAVTLTFGATPAAGARVGEFPVKAVAEITGTEPSDRGYQIIEYQHTHRRHVVEAARTRVKVIDVTIAPALKVGYIMGVGDQMPEAIEQLGAEVHLIEPDELASGDLSDYNVIVTGVRAYERRDDLRANNHRLLRYVEEGGTVLVNYNKGEFNQAQYGPYPAKNSSARVTDENAPVEILVPDSPVFNRPNPIGPETWAGWVQERGTYFLTDTDPRYENLVRITDPFPFNPQPKTGALVRAAYGKGQWIYLGLGLWRQLPAGTDGAYRLLANLLSLGARE
jgi:LmbE family N-acetylglucosaminyl deacetylase